jgi:hypothetical protein
MWQWRPLPHVVWSVDAAWAKALLRERLGEAYAGYAARVPRFVPGGTRWKGGRRCETGSSSISA